MTQLSKLLLIVFLPLASLAQGQGRVIKLKSGDFFAPSNVNNVNQLKSDLMASLFKERYHVLVTFSSLLPEASRKELELTGIVLQNFINNDTYFATIPGNYDFLSVSAYNITGINVIPPNLKIDNNLRLHELTGKYPANPIAVIYSSDVSRDTVVNLLKHLGAIVVPTKYDQPGLVFINIGYDQLITVASFPFVIYLNKQSLIDIPINYNNNAAHGNATLSYNGPGGRSLTGKAISVGVGDNSDVSTHTDFAGRLINRTPTGVTYHGTHTTGTVGGAGIVNEK